jgi:hypothetical protein
MNHKKKNKKSLKKVCKQYNDENIIHIQADLTKSLGYFYL